MSLKHLALGAVAALTLVGLAGGINNYLRQNPAQAAPSAASVVTACYELEQPITLSGTMVRLGTSQIVALQLAHPICTKPYTLMGITDEAEHGVTKLQLESDGCACYPAGLKLIGKPVIITGKLEHSSTIHHSTPILLDLEKIAVQP